MDGNVSVHDEDTLEYIRKMYRELDFIEAYRKHTDIRVEEDPHAAIGGQWGNGGRLLTSILIRQGLDPEHTLLDIGCGTLRIGRRLIRYLDCNNYYGIDISKKAIDYGHTLIKNENLLQKSAHLQVTNDLKFNEFEGKTFDFLFANSVFTHIGPQYIEECFDNLNKVMESDSHFIFSYVHREEVVQYATVNWGYPISYFQSILPAGFTLKKIEGRGCNKQFLLKVTKI